MNWFSRLKFAFFQARFAQGEYWITNTGDAMFADGDVGDYNHEAHVIQNIWSKYDIDTERVDPTSAEFLDEFAQKHFDDVVALLRRQGNWGPKMDQLYRKNPQQAIIEAGRAIDYTDVLAILGATPDEIKALGSDGDARLFAKKFWGWKRLMGNDIETWTLTPADMKAIANGLWEAYQDEAEEFTYTITVESNNKWFADIPYDVIASDDPMQVINYQTRDQMQL